MLTNFSIRSKILIVFLVVIGLLAALSATVIVGNAMTASNLDRIDVFSTFQATANSLVDAYSDARIGANVLYASQDVESYQRAVSGHEHTMQFLDELNAMCAEYPAVAMFEDELASIGSDLTSWRTQVGEIETSYLAIDDLFAAFSASGVDITEKAEKLYNHEQSLMQEYITAAMPSGSLRTQQANLCSAADMLINIQALRRSFLHMVDLLDTSAAQTSIDSATGLITTIQDFAVANANTESAQLALELVSSLNNYMGIVEGYAAEVDRNNAIVDTASSLGTATLANITSMMNDIDASVQSEIESSVATSNTIRIVVIVLSAVAIIAGIILALSLARGISSPVIMMSQMLRQMGEKGSLKFADDLTAKAEKATKWKDEIGECARAVNGLRGHLLEIEDALKTISSGDLTADVVVLSVDDAMGMSLRQMTTSLNSMFAEIGQSTAQVSTGSKQIADGSQTLAQGSTEQAAAVEELSSSISEIADKTRENAQMATKAATLATNIMHSAENGSKQMDAMMKAVSEINQASQSINKVIKVIDDIAFQTNILALNAAVEAARAGQHGKGFAVVAEEVRNLAGKSAEAAKDTGVLIVNSIEKAELGAKIADDTALSLNEIVEGINENTRLLAEIAKSSEEQSTGIGQINQGIDQVAQVVQQNSATAEESAAASQQMSGQAEMLQQLISQFKLKSADLL